MRVSRLIVLVIAVVVAAACSGSGGGAQPSAAPRASPAASSSPAPGMRIAVKLTDALRMEPAAMAVPRGVPVTFVVTNSGAIDHEFFLGDEAAQMAHEHEMGMGGMAHEVPNAITTKPGETKELTFTFTQSGVIVAGCHVPGHYPGGMKAQITVS